jgi:hypothetical protein
LEPSNSTLIARLRIWRFGSAAATTRTETSSSGTRVRGDAGWVQPPRFDAGSGRNVRASAISAFWAAVPVFAGKA